jgi:hypothetical protein
MEINKCADYIWHLTIFWFCQDDDGKEKIKEVSLMSKGCHSKLDIN